MKTAFWYGLYLSFYATLWLTFFNGVNVYMDRFQNAMAFVYIATNCLFAFLVFCMWVVNYAMEKGDVKLTRSMKEFTESEKAKDFVNINERHEKWYFKLYKYGAFYPAIFCALILLGYVHLGTAMALDVFLVYMLKSQVSSLLEKTKNFSQAEKSKESK